MIKKISILINEVYMNSTLCPGTKASLIKKISVTKIKKKYKKHGINLDYIFKSYEYVSIYECNRSKYRFYYPFDIAGDSTFYEHFQQFNWYYMPWKWEHEITLKYVNPGLRILEVGCAHGAFLKKISEVFNLSECVGLELNKSAAVQNEKWKIENATIEEYASKFSGHFDMVCSYQVLEHIWDVFSFLKSSVNCLKIEGKLIISVPNNESFINTRHDALNMPPHHMGLWNTESLKYLETLFPIELVDIHYETLQEYHVDSYISSQFYNRENILTKIRRRVDKLSGKYEKLKRKVLAERNSIIGHTVLIVFKKIN